MVVIFQGRGVYLTSILKHGLNVLDGDGVGAVHFIFLCFFPEDLSRCPCLVDEVDGLVGQEAVADVLRALPNGIVDDLVRVGHLVELFITRAQTFYNMYSVVD